MRRSILIVDDDVHIQDLLKLFLEQAGFECRLCKDGYSALDEISKKPFDLVILDISMPHMNGLKVLQHMKNSHSMREIPVLMLTGSADKSDVQKATRFGVTDYVIKPPKKEDLVQRVERVLGGAPPI